MSKTPNKTRIHIYTSHTSYESIRWNMLEVFCCFFYRWLFGLTAAADGYIMSLFDIIRAYTRMI